LRNVFVTPILCDHVIRAKVEQAGDAARRVNTNAEVVRLLQHPDVSKRFSSAGVEPQTTTPEAFGELIAREAATWGKVVKAANIRVE
jgi:tripartite-type tricarboxylate transporter receptor subunit TctC